MVVVVVVVCAVSSAKIGTATKEKRGLSGSRSQSEEAPDHKLLISHVSRCLVCMLPDADFVEFKTDMPNQFHL